MHKRRRPEKESIGSRSSSPEPNFHKKEARRTSTKRKKKKKKVSQANQKALVDFLLLASPVVEAVTNKRGLGGERFSFSLLPPCG
jgi:hypothetical protein